MAMTKHAARQTFVAIGLLAALLSTTLRAHGEDTGRATPPEWMPALTAEAIQRLSLKIDRLMVLNHARPAVPPKVELFKKEAQALDDELYRFALVPLFLAADRHVEVLKQFQVRHVVAGYGPQSLPASGMADVHFDGVSVYAFEEGAGEDPAKLLWTTLRGAAGTELQEVGDVEVLHRKAKLIRDTEDFYYWSPRPRVAIVVRRMNLLTETVLRWSEREPSANRFPWSLPEWDLIAPNASAWVIRRALNPEAGRVNGAIALLDAAKHPESVRFVWPGINNRNAEPPAGSDMFPVPNGEFEGFPLSRTGGSRLSMSIQIPLEAGFFMVIQEYFLVGGNVHVPRDLQIPDERAEGK